MSNLIPISTLFIGINGLIALALSYLTVIERTKADIWHGHVQDHSADEHQSSLPKNSVAAIAKDLKGKMVC